MMVTRVFAGADGCAAAAQHDASTAAVTASASARAQVRQPSAGTRRRTERCIGRRSGRGLDVLFDVLCRILLVHLFLLGDHLGDRGLCLRVLSRCCRDGLGLRRGRLGLCSLDRSELLLGRQLATLGNDERLHLHVYVLEELDRDAEAADPLERVAGDLAPVDADLPCSPDLVGDVGRRDRAEERARRAGLHLEPQHGLAEELGDLLSLVRAPRLVLRACGVDLLQLRHARRRGVLRQLAGKQVVPRVAASDVDDVPPQASFSTSLRRMTCTMRTPLEIRSRGTRARGNP